MKIGVITLYYRFKWDNYGGTLQNYALVKYLRNCGYDAKTVGFLYYRTPFHIMESVTKKIFDKTGLLIDDMSKKIQLQKLESKRNQQFKIFVEKYIPLEECWIKNIDDYKTVDSKYDKFIVGSDQVWNPYWAVNKITYLSYLLAFTSSEKRISYAASIGTNEIPIEKQKMFKDELPKFKNISVREDKAAEIVKDLIGEDVQVVLDPTLLVDADEWRKIEKKPESIDVNQPYILTYFLGNGTEEQNKIIENVANKNNLKVINLLDKSNKELYCAGPDVFLYLISHSKLVCTDSFHACVFSFLNEKPFLVFDRKDKEKNMNSRIETFLKTFKLEKHYYDKNNNDIFVTDYQDGKCILEEKRKFSYNYLKSSLDIK